MITLWNHEPNRISWLHSKEAKHSSPSKLPRGSFVPIDMRRAYNKLFVQTTFPLVETLPRTGGDFHFTFQPLPFPFLRIFVEEARMFSNPRANKGADWNVFALELSDRWRRIGTCQVPRSYVASSKRVSKEEGCSCIHGITLSFLSYFLYSPVPRKRYDSPLGETRLKEDFDGIFTQPSFNPSEPSIILSTIIRIWNVFFFNVDRITRPFVEKNYKFVETLFNIKWLRGGVS